MVESVAEVGKGGQREIEPRRGTEARVQISISDIASDLGIVILIS